MRPISSKDRSHPPELYEYFSDSFCLWWETTDLLSGLNPPLKGRQKADIVVVGGGFTGMASAYHLRQRFPDQRIVVIEGACCGYGASGRNGGHALVGMHGIGDICKKRGPEEARKVWDMTLMGFNQIKELVETHGIDCDLEETGKLVLATQERHIPALGSFKTLFDQIGLESQLLDRDELQKYLKSERYLAGWRDPHGGHLNPAKLASGLKRVIQEMGVEIFERSKVCRIVPGTTVVVETEMGEIAAPKVILGLNGYAPQLGLFSNNLMSLVTNVIATEPLTADQLASIGWLEREGLGDMRGLDFNYFILSADNRIVFGGEAPVFSHGNRPSRGIYKATAEKLKKSLLLSFPQLDGVEVTHQWSGTVGFTLDASPFIGAMGPDRNLYYAAGYSGEGVVLTQVAGKILSHLVAGDDDALTRMPIVRKPPYALHEPFRYPAFKLYCAYLDRFGTNLAL